MNHKKIILLLSSAVCVVLMSGCAELETRPGHPNSFEGTFFGQNYYKNGLVKRRWPTSREAFAKLDDAEKSDGSSGGGQVPSPPPAYLSTDKPFEIWQARGIAWNKYLEYSAAAFKAQDVQDAMAVPIFGAAIASAATAIAHASTVAIGAAGLSGTSLYAVNGYLHPGVDATTDQTAASQLLCIVDRSQPLRDMSVVPLILDKAALQDALDTLSADAGGLLGKTSPTSSEQAAQKAVTSVEDAAAAAMKNLNDAITAYNSLPSEMNVTTDKVDNDAKSGGARVLADWAGILSSLQTSAMHQASKDTASGEVQNAKGMVADAVAAKSAKGKSAAAPVLAKKATTKEGAKQPDLPPTGSNLAALTVPATGSEATPKAQASKPETASATGSADTGKAGTNEQQVTKLANVLNDQETNDMQKVTRITADSANDIPSPNFSEILANILVCIPAPGTTPATAGKT